MPENQLWQDHKHIVLLCNFGGPEKHEEVEPFLFELFSDPFIIRAPLGPFRSLLAKRISRKRAPLSAKEYEKIGFSPIKRYTQIQASHLESELRKTHSNTEVVVVNRYTTPRPKDILEKITPSIQGPKTRYFMISLYPQFCHSTTASSFKDVDSAIMDAKIDPTIVRIYSWWSQPIYMSHCYEALQDQLDKVPEDGQPITILYSAHGIPIKYHEKGDPYGREVTAQFESLSHQLNTSNPKLESRLHQTLTYQSRVGPVKWLQPYTDQEIKTLGKQRGGHLILAPVSFTCDHIETLYEMDVTYRNLAIESGFKEYYRALPANEDPRLAQALANSLRQNGF